MHARGELQVLRPTFYRYLQAIVDAGFTNRVMFGSDQMVWPGTIERGIALFERWVDSYKTLKPPCR